MGTSPLIARRSAVALAQHARPAMNSPTGSRAQPLRERRDLARVAAAGRRERLQLHLHTPLWTGTLVGGLLLERLQPRAHRRRMPRIHDRASRSADERRGGCPRRLAEPAAWPASCARRRGRRRHISWTSSPKARGAADEGLAIGSTRRRRRGASGRRRRIQRRGFPLRRDLRLHVATAAEGLARRSAARRRRQASTTAWPHDEWLEAGSGWHGDRRADATDWGVEDHPRARRRRLRPRAPVRLVAHRGDFCEDLWQPVSRSMLLLRNWLMEHNEDGPSGALTARSLRRACSRRRDASAPPHGGAPMSSTPTLLARLTEPRGAHLDCSDHQPAGKRGHAGGGVPARVPQRRDRVCS